MHGLAIVVLTADAEVNLREWKYLLKGKMRRIKNKIAQCNVDGEANNSIRIYIVFVCNWRSMLDALRFRNVFLSLEFRRFYAEHGKAAKQQHERNPLFPFRVHDLTFNLFVEKVRNTPAREEKLDWARLGRSWGSNNSQSAAFEMWIWRAQLSVSVGRVMQHNKREASLIQRNARNLRFN